VGDGSNNVATSLIMAAGKVGMSVRVIAPQDYQPDPAVLKQSGTDVIVTDELVAVTGADVVYTDTWTSMGQEEEREERLKAFPKFQVNEQLLSITRNSDIKVMHCLPAHRGEEITDDVADGPNSLIFPQAHNRLHAQKALLAHLLGGVPLQ